MRTCVSIQTLLSLSLITPAAFAIPHSIPSRVDAVTVFPSGATVHRVGRLRLEAGEHQVVFGGLPPELVDETLRIGGFGPGVSAESVSVRLGRRAEMLTRELEGLTRECSTLDRERAATPEARRAELTQRLATCTLSLARVRAEGEQHVKFVTVDLSAASEGELSLSLEYLLPLRAGWRPSYAARLDTQGARVGLDTFATVQQSTGEDWIDVRLSVSSMVPSVGLALPHLQEQNISLETPEPSPGLMRLSMRPMSGARGMSAMASQQPSQEDAASVPVPVPVTPVTPLEQPHGAVRANLLSARMELPNLVTVRTDTTPRRLLATHSDFSATLEHQAAPRQTHSVFLAARFRNGDTPLLEGPVSLFIGQDYVGTTALQQLPLGEELLLPFGVDAGVTLDRTLTRRQVASAGGRGQTTLRYQYRVSNHRDRALQVTVFEQLPVSRSQGLTVRTLPGERAPLAHQESDPPGVLRWQVRVGPGATERWALGYVVSAPQRRGIEGTIE